MIESITSRAEGDYLLIVASGKIVSNKEYRSLLKRYCEEIATSGLTKVLIDERDVEYVPSFFPQVDIVRYYSSGELPEEFATWRLVCVGAPDAFDFYVFWESLAQRSGYDHWAFTSMDKAREFLAGSGVDSSHG